MLSLQQFSVVGFSAGGPYVFAAAVHYPHPRLVSAHAIAPLAPYSEPGLAAGMPLSSRFFYSVGIVGQAWIASLIRAALKVSHVLDFPQQKSLMSSV